MLLDRYEQNGLFFNMNFKEKAGDDSAYRGELVITEGEVGDASGRRKPPVLVMKQAVVLCNADQIKMLCGQLDELAQIETLFERYKADLATDAQVVLYLANIKDPMISEYQGVKLTLIPFDDAMVWNELIDELALEKGDFKGQSAGEKVATVFGAMSGYAPKYPTVSWEDAQTKTVAVRRASRGPI